MTPLLFLHNDVSFSHQLDVPFICWFCMVIGFSITTQIPRIHNLNCTIGELFKLTCANGHSFTTAKLSVAHLLSSLLRLTTCPISNGRTFFTSTHNACNVMRGRRLLLRHSVKHYKAPGLKNTNRVITSFF